jgi:sigma-B regulation protein RsbU (phosphoserine phosphatase)
MASEIRSLKKYNSSGYAFQKKDNELISLLLKRQSELNSLLEITQAINKNSPSKVLFEMLEIILKMHLKVSDMCLLVKEEDQFNVVAEFGGPPEDAEVLQQICQSLQKREDITSLVNSKHKLLSRYDFYIPVFHKDYMMAFALIGGSFNGSNELMNNDLNFIQTLINVIFVALENKRLFKEEVTREFLQRDIKLAREVQNGLIPLNLPYDDELKVGAHYLPNQNIGGDYFDFIRLNEHEFLWCIADVSGKGVAAALLMANLQASLRAWVTMEVDLEKIITQLNYIVDRNTKGDQTITLFIAKFNQQTREIQYVNAGHIPPILLMNEEIFLLKEGTILLGGCSELPFINIGSIKLLPNSLIFNYTDGLIESDNEDVFITEDELIKYLKLNRYFPVNLLNLNVLNSICEVHNAKMDTDDITLFTLKIT